MKSRMYLAYNGAIALLILLSPLLIIEPLMGGPMMYVVILSSPISLISALSYSDYKMNFSPKANITRTTMGGGVYALPIGLFVLMSHNLYGLVLVVIFAPLLSVISTRNIMSMDGNIAPPLKSQKRKKSVIVIAASICAVIFSVLEYLNGNNIYIIAVGVWGIILLIRKFIINKHT
jgi:uncharacterized membrane protein